jgi:hypothetical protein
MQNLESAVAASKFAAPISAPEPVRTVDATDTAEPATKATPPHPQLIETLEGEIRKLQAQRLEAMRLRDRALLPKSNNPGQATDRTEADRQHAEMKRLADEIEIRQAQIEVAREAEREHRRQEREHDHQERLRRIAGIAERRERAAAALDRASATYGKAFRALLEETEALKHAAIRLDTGHITTSGASGSATIDMTRQRLRADGVSWAAPQPVFFDPKPPTIADHVRLMNDRLLAAQPQHLEDPWAKPDRRS